MTELPSALVRVRIFLPSVSTCSVGPLSTPSKAHILFSLGFLFSLPLFLDLPSTALMGLSKVSIQVAQLAAESLPFLSLFLLEDSSLVNLEKRRAFYPDGCPYLYLLLFSEKDLHIEVDTF